MSIKNLFYRFIRHLPIQIFLFSTVLVFFIYYRHTTSTIYNTVNNMTEVYFQRSSDIIAHHTTLYYNTSTFYNKNTAIILFYGDDKLKLDHKWNCKSLGSIGNNFEELNLPANIKPIAPLSMRCPWAVYLAECRVVPNPGEIAFTLKNDSSQSIALPYELPDRTPRGVVSCFAPMFFEERWHTIALTHELFAHWGVDLQVHYVQSVASEILTLLQPLVSKNLLEIRGIDLPDFGSNIEKKLGYNPMKESEFRQQVMAIQDCYFRYRESAEFIMVGDPDDVFIPMKGSTLLDDFKHWQKIAPTASYFHYDRLSAFGKTASSIKNFSAAKTLASIRYINKIEVGKSVYQTKFSETPWIHWGGVMRTEPFKVPTSDGFVMHLTLSFNTTEELPEGKLLTESVNITRLLKPQGTVTNFKDAAKTLETLPLGPPAYAKVIKECYNNFTANPSMFEANFCTTPTRCTFEPRNMRCHVAVRFYKTSCLQNDELCIIMPSTAVAPFVTREKGCAFGDVVKNEHFFKR